MRRCGKCKQIKSLIKFRQYKSGKNKGYYNSYCNLCKNLHRRERRKIPWIRVKDSIQSRCLAKKSRYFKKGIKLLLTLEELKTLWFRDKAYLMKRPSIHRNNNNENYTLENCKFIELSENCRIGNLGLKHKKGKDGKLDYFKPREE